MLSSSPPPLHAANTPPPTTHTAYNNSEIGSKWKYFFGDRKVVQLGVKDEARVLGVW